MRNAILRYYLKSAKVDFTGDSFVQPKQHVQWLLLGFPRLKRQISRNFWRTKTQKIGKISFWKKNVEEPSEKRDLALVLKSFYVDARKKMVLLTLWEA